MLIERRKNIARKEDIAAKEVDEESTREIVSPRDTDNDEKTKVGNFFTIKAAVIGLWIPCVVGKKEHTFKLISLTSFTARTFFLILAFILAIFNVVPSCPFLIYCSPHLENNSCYSISECFNNDVTTAQKTRFCEDTSKDPAFLLFTICVFISGVFSMLGSYVLCKMSEYYYMFSASKKCCWFLPCPLFPCCLTSALSPIIHRNLIFTVLDKNEDEEGAKKLKEIFSVASQNEENLQTIASRPLQGETPLTVSVKKSKPNCATGLLRNGSKIENNSVGEYPVNIAVRKKDVNMVKVLLAKGGVIKEDKSGKYPANIAVRNKDIDMVKFLLVNGAVIKTDSTGEHPVKDALTNFDQEMLNILLRSIEFFDEKTKTHLLNSESKFGTIQAIVKQTLILNVLEHSQLGEEMKVKTLRTFKKAGVTSIPVDSISPNAMNRVQELVRDWNTKHMGVQLEICQRKLYDNNGSMLTVRTFTTDRETSLEGEKTITSVEITKRGWSINQMRLQYGEDWGE